MDDYGSSKPVPQTGNNGLDEQPQLEENSPEEALAAVLSKVEQEKQEEQAQEEENSPDWDGSEAEFVPDEDAAVYEEQYTGIGLTYTLRHEEVLSCLKRGGICKTTGVRAWAETGLMAVMAVMFFASFFLYGNGYNILLGVACLVVIAAIWLVPHLGMKRQAKEIADGKEIHVEVYPDTVEVGRKEHQWEIPLDGTSSLEEYDDMMVLTTPKKQMLAIPLRSVEPSVLPDVQAMLMAGTLPAEEETI